MANRAGAVQLQLRKFDPSTMPDNATCVFLGRRRTGKSTLVTDILYYKRHLPAGVVMSATEDGNGHYRQFVPDLFIYNDFSREAAEKLYERQRRLKAAGKYAPVFFLMDDCMYDKTRMKEPIIREIFMNGRHYNIFFLFTAQYAMDVPPAIRGNIDYVFVLRDNIRKNRENLYESFFGCFPNKDMFFQVMDSCTENYECLVLDNTGRSNRIEDNVFWYKAPIRRNFRIGSDAMWQYHRQHYKSAPTGTNSMAVASRPRGSQRVVVKKT